MPPGKIDQPEAHMTTPVEELKIWIAIRQDIHIPRGKDYTQIGHGVDMVIEQAETMCPDTLRAYRAAARPKITCKLDSLEHMIKVYDACRLAGLPTAFVVDAGRTVFGSPTATVFAVGPCYRSQLPSAARRLQLLVEKLPETAKEVDAQSDGTVS
jgi:PTH2 family peptidyl-tRNA hydrolase